MRSRQDRNLLVVSVILAGLLTLVLPASAAEGDFAWAAGMGSVNDDFARDIVVDQAGNVYVTGAFQGTVDFDPGAGTFNLTAAGDSDVFVSKLSTNGDLVWARHFGGTGHDAGNGIFVDGEGCVYFTGVFSDTADFDPGVGVTALTSAGSGDVFVSKIDENGDLVWSNQLGGVNEDIGRAIAVDTAGNVFVTGEFQDTADFDPSASTFNLASNGSADIFTWKLNSNGELVWAKHFGGTSIDAGYGISVNGVGVLHLMGIFQGTSDFDPGTGIFNISSAGSNDIFVLNLSEDGDLVWAKSFGGASNDVGRFMVVDVTGNVYTTGEFQGTADFDPGAGSFNLTSAGINDTFVSKLTQDGEFVWAKSLEGDGLDFGLGVAVDGAGNIYLTGHFSGTTDFDPGVGSFPLSSAGSDDVFVCKLNASANFVWAKSMGSGGGDTGRGLALDSAGNAYLAGYFSDTVDFDPGLGTFNLTSVGNLDAFVSKLLGSDTTGPNALTVVPNTTGPTSDTVIDFTVTFDEAVVNFADSSDLIVAHTGTSHSGVTIEGGPTIFTVSVSGVGGDGTFTIAVDTDSDVQDLTGNALVSSAVSEAVTVDNTSPSITIDAPSSSTTIAGPVTFLVTYTGADTITLSPADVTLNATGSATGTVGVSGSGSTRTVTLSGIGGDGTLGISIGANTASDLAGNLALAVGPSETLNVDNTPPNKPIVAGSSPTNDTTPTWTWTTGGGGNGTYRYDLDSLGWSGTTATDFTPGSPLGEGVHRLTVQERDDAGNWSTDGFFDIAVDLTPPIVEISAPSSTTTTTGPVTFDVSYTDADPGTITLDATDVLLNVTNSATATVDVSGTGSIRTVTLSNISGDGTLGISIGANTASDIAGNSALGAGPSLTVSVENGATLGTPIGWRTLLIVTFVLTLLLFRIRNRTAI